MSWLEVEAVVNDFAEHASGKLGKADAPGALAGLSDPGMRGRKKIINGEMSVEAGAFIKNRFQFH